ncbi:MAG: hypothetical protein K8S18_20630 [Desulfobacula sp.]|nr:hypothetical protein [Desulfobacula sp.]
MKKKLNIKVEEVKIDKELQSSGMYGGACGGACGGGAAAGNAAAAAGIGNIGSIAAGGGPGSGMFGGSSSVNCGCHPTDVPCIAACEHMKGIVGTNRNGLGTWHSVHLSEIMKGDPTSCRECHPGP